MLFCISLPVILCLWQHHTRWIWCRPVLPWSVARGHRQTVQFRRSWSLDNCWCNSSGYRLRWPCRWVTVHCL